MPSIIASLEWIFYRIEMNFTLMMSSIIFFSGILDLDNHFEIATVMLVSI